MLKLLAVAIVVLVVVAASDPPPPSGGEGQTGQQQTATEKHGDSNGAQRNPDPAPTIQSQQPQDHHPVATQPHGEGKWYTLPDWWVAIFTALLFIATCGLWIFTALLWNTTRKAVSDGESAIATANAAVAAANRHADASARAADISERMLTEHYRPWIFRDIVHIEPRPTTSAGPWVNHWWVELRWKNIGKSPAMIEQFQFAFTDIKQLPATPDYSKCEHAGVVPSLPEGDAFESIKHGPGIGKNPDGSTIEYVYWGRLIYREMNGKQHVSGFALRINPHFPGATEDSAEQAYNYYT